MIYHHLNLTNGLTHAQYLSSRDSVQTIRIESTACEQKHWEKIVRSATPDLILQYATGQEIVFHDTSEKDRVPRALWQGVSFIEYALSRQWKLTAEHEPWIIVPRGNKAQQQDVHQFFNSCFECLPKPARNYLQYFNKFRRVERIRPALFCTKTPCNLRGYTGRNPKIQEDW